MLHERREWSGKNAKFNAKLVARFPFLWGVAKEQHSYEAALPRLGQPPFL
jgi:hypothetical protein